MPLLQIIVYVIRLMSCSTIRSRAAEAPQPMEERFVSRKHYLKKSETPAGDLPAVEKATGSEPFGLVIDTKWSVRIFS